MPKKFTVPILIFVFAELLFVVIFWNNDSAIRFLALANGAMIVTVSLYRMFGRKKKNGFG